MKQNCLCKYCGCLKSCHGKDENSIELRFLEIDPHVPKKGFAYALENCPGYDCKNEASAA